MLALPFFLYGKGGCGWAVGTGPSKPGLVRLTKGGDSGAEGPTSALVSRAAIDADTKLIASWFVADRSAGAAYVERQYLTMRMSMRRFTRLTNAFSKKVENHAAAVALYFMFYNFARVHQTIRVTPAMEAGNT